MECNCYHFDRIEKRKCEIKLEELFLFLNNFFWIKHSRKIYITYFTIKEQNPMKLTFIFRHITSYTLHRNKLHNIKKQKLKKKHYKIPPVSCTCSNHRLGTRPNVTITHHLCQNFGKPLHKIINRTLLISYPTEVEDSRSDK